ncbi:hypothetical protein M2132_000093 [Dysgonomonas sp. PH5-45]|uniref:hypothetical protein n=1 Tax=unclassified Dysgonomonas TaxID=2630389 RepID=UPI002474D79D|nr:MULTISPECIES: hypothetical protein [unclassified Dysgonomonas]MDH6353776.1 hypothetical protein [Dysgonomonas sp. PH5-45]MDH6386679.1 hypothetical protein [Dysgonomonas sp. PH5-37]
MKSLKYIKILLPVVLFFSFAGMKAQVTIGQDQKTEKGAILQLKEKAGTDANSTRGLLMPRVNLLKETGANMLATMEGADTGWDMTAHAGLWVYNTNTVLAENICPGLYCWLGNRWLRMHEPCTPPHEPCTPPCGTTNNSHASDIAALKEIYNNNPGNTLNWNFDTESFGTDGIGNPCVKWETDECGEKRLIWLYIGDSQISSLDGIEKLLKLEHLSIFDLPLTSIDVSQNKNLTLLDAQRIDGLGYIDVTQNPKLEVLLCERSAITSLDVSQNTNLKHIECQSNELIQSELDKFLENPAYCLISKSKRKVIPQRYVGNPNNPDPSIVEPTCP